MLTCEWCNTQFERQGTRGPKPRFCSVKCRGKWQYSQPHIKEYQKAYAKRPDRLIKKQAYAFRYNRRPEVKAKNRERMKIKWWSDPAYRERELERLSRMVRHFSQVEIPSLYSGHRWLDMARQAVAPNGMEPAAVSADDRYDEMGEALLALLEGRDMNEAVREYRKKEFKPRYMTLHWDDFRGEDGDSYADIIMPKAPSAEEEAVARIVVDTPFKFYRKGAMSRHMRHRTQQPKRRRMKDASSWQKNQQRSA